ncbi:single-stranded-DNA-specific exonuclease RecJ [Candidatus Woesebacteria bacterium]|nr:single-stranded-DNA-specific exonuclease RecJ [Candidatus Woesebacteria bacterium]
MIINTKCSIKAPITANEIIKTILVSRGLNTVEEQAEFLSPREITLDYLYAESGITKESLSAAQTLIDKHLESGSDICIFGDYDADGVSATAVLYLGLSEYIKKSGSTSRLLPFIPDRHKHGYGLSNKAIAEVMDGTAFIDASYEGFHPKLIITVDTGIVAHDGIDTFVHEGIEVIITDHHLPDSTLPKANSIVHSTITSGAGVSWILVCHLLASTSKLLDLATIGIIADMMPLVGFNRTLVVSGLKALSASSSPGFRALKARMGIPERPLTSYDISYGIAPRINAAGRIYSPLHALRLLCTTDNGVATSLAEEIESHNIDRQELTESALTHALEQPFNNKITALVGPYHEGVIGLVAGKLVEAAYRPAIVMSDNGDVIKGSARSIPGFNITGFLRSLKTPFLGLGGHDQAAGFSIERVNLQLLLDEVSAVGNTTISDDLLIRHENADMELPLNNATLELAKKLTKLEPYGLGNNKPRFLFKNVKVVEDRALGELGKHHKLTIEQDGIRLPLLMFNTKHSHPINHVTQCIATIDVNVWNNKESVQLVSTYVET